MNWTDIFIAALVAHILGDWLFSNGWLAMNKHNLKHPAAYIHSGIITLFMLLAFSWPIAIINGIIHLLIDTRIPTKWWMKVTGKDEFFWLVIVQDQMIHLITYALFSYLIAGKYI